MERIDLLENLIKNDSIQVNCLAKDWKQAIQVCIEPLIKKHIVEAKYYDAIIESVKANGPYFILMDHVAMPHAEGKLENVHDNGFSLVTLQEPVYFDNDDRPVSVLIGLASNSPDIHVAVALPQIAAILEDESNVEKLRNAKSKDEVIAIIKKVDLQKNFH
ncbi:PTS sugar transporter subunit IIA [[Mycoplasma] testudinis]|uniref:PTS sugar transporter subunit IIA n=1 Tax=[Mycoplasma] testudinis TaxID=33924 RepID=UPI0005686265|nr:PTS sugar transporter subunit IIA [[Mycoplasma] testudinis]